MLSTHSVLRISGLTWHPLLDKRSKAVQWIGDRRTLGPDRNRA